MFKRCLTRKFYICHALTSDFQKAKDYHARALDIRVKQLGPKHIDVAASYNNLGTVYRNLSDLQKAKHNHVRALDIRVKQLGPEHVGVAASYNNLGTVYSDLGCFQKAKDNYARAPSETAWIRAWKCRIFLQ